MSMEMCAILDCGGQYTKVIDRKVRELGVYSEIFPIGVNPEKLKNASCLILSGGPGSVWSSEALEFDARILDLGLPILGICYGMQLLCDHFGGKVVPAVKTEYGQTPIDIDNTCPLFKGLSTTELVLMNHGDAVTEMPKGFACVARTGNIIAGIYDEKRRIAGVQFHPEVDLTVNGLVIFQNFLRTVCGLKEQYALEDRIETSVRMIRERVGENGKVVVLVSGGVDSAVTAALLIKALRRDQVYAIHIDHGLMRKNESDLICENLEKLGLTEMQRINAEDAFFHTPLTIDGKSYKPLSETCDPEQKRAIIGHMFFVVTEEAAKKLNLDFRTAFLAQGTLRPDLIESGNPLVSGYANTIKTHHNDVGVIRTLRDAGHVIETNWDWHKDEVRKVARMLGLDEAIASRQPFPGPGLGVRLLCNAEEKTSDPEKCKVLREFLDKLGTGYEGAIAPIQSVGVQGDHRSYRSLAVIAGKDGNPGFDRVSDTARLIPNTLDFINRIALRVDGGRVPETLYSAEMHICHETAELLRDIDAAVTDTVMTKGISQCFAVLIPVSTVKEKKYSAVIRAVVTSDFMTARAAVPGQDFTLEALDACVKRIKAEHGDVLDMILYDVTGKPPATIEWE